MSVEVPGKSLDGKILHQPSDPRKKVGGEFLIND
jgi:hypothetical protein